MIRKSTFVALRVPNFRRFFAGQSVSLVGTWMQSVAQAWLVLQLTSSPTTLGLLVAVQTLPILLFGPYGGLIADRADKRRVMAALQAAMGLLALLLGVLTVTGLVRVWEVFIVAALLGTCNAFESPARQSFVLEMVGRDELPNAIALNSVMVNAARAIGPAVAGILIAVVGTGVCFLLNAASFVAVVYSLLSMNVALLTPVEPTPRQRGQVRAGLRYVWHTPALLVPLLMIAVVGALAYEFQVSLPVMAREAFDGSSTTFGYMSSAMGAGAVVGGLFVAARGSHGLRPLSRNALLFGCAILLAAIAPNVIIEVVALALVGAASIAFLATGNSTLQLNADPAMRGRVMALWAVAFLGSTPIGGPIVGWVSEFDSGRWGLALGGFACLAAGIAGWIAKRRACRIEPAAGAPDLTPDAPDWESAEEK